MKRLASLAFLLIFSVAARGQARLETINGYRVLHVEGTPEAMGEQHGRLLRDEIRRMVEDLVGDATPLQMEKAMVMERHLPARYRRELAALAESAGVNYERLVLAQLFGDVARAPQCTSFAAFGEATETGECIAGRNFDYWDSGVSAYGAVLIHMAPEGFHRFVTVSWAGIINGWTLMNERGIVVANNTGFCAADNSLEGISTCFLLRKVAEEAGTVEDGIQIVRDAPRACGTIMLVAGGTPPDAAEIEFDHSAIAVRKAERGVVVADNSFRLLYQEEPVGDDEWGRYGTLISLIRENYGRINSSTNLSGARGVPMEGINLHSAVLCPASLTIAVSMGKTPACRYPYRWFRMTERGIVSAEQADD